MKGPGPPGPAFLRLGLRVGDGPYFGKVLGLDRLASLAGALQDWIRCIRLTNAPRAVDGRSPPGGMGMAKRGPSVNCPGRGGPSVT